MCSRFFIDFPDVNVQQVYFYKKCSIKNIIKYLIYFKYHALIVVKYLVNFHRGTLYKVTCMLTCF